MGFLFKYIIAGCLLMSEMFAKQRKQQQMKLINEIKFVMNRFVISAALLNKVWWIFFESLLSMLFCGHAIFEMLEKFDFFFQKYLLCLKMFCFKLRLWEMISLYFLIYLIIKHCFKWTSFVMLIIFFVSNFSEDFHLHSKIFHFNQKRLFKFDWILSERKERSRRRKRKRNK